MEIVQWFADNGQSKDFQFVLANIRPQKATSKNLSTSVKPHFVTKYGRIRLLIVKIELCFLNNQISAPISIRLKPRKKPPQYRISLISLFHAS